MTAICYIGIELNAATQRWLLALEFIILVVFAVVALIKVYTGHPAALGPSAASPGSTRSRSRAASAR